MTAVSPAKGIYDILAALNAPAYTANGWAFAVGQLTPMPDKQVVVKHSGGRSGEVLLAIDYPSVQFIARGKPGAGGYEEAYQKLVEARAALVAIPSHPTAFSTLDSCIQRGNILDLGQDDKNRPMFALNLSLIVSNATDGYRT